MLLLLVAVDQDDLEVQGDTHRQHGEGEEGPGEGGGCWWEEGRRRRKGWRETLKM